MNTMIRVLSFGLLLCVPGLALAAEPQDKYHNKYYKEIVDAPCHMRTEVRPSQAAREQAARKQADQEQAREAHAELQRREQLDTGIGLFKGE